MPQSKTEKIFNNFGRGLITEAGELTFPEGASVDELNCTLDRDGARARRKGVAVEDTPTYSSFTVTSTELFHTGVWRNVGGDNSLEYTVLQVGSSLRFYDRGAAPLSSHEVTGSVDLTTYERTGSNGSETAPVQLASIKGALVVVSPEIKPIYVTRDNGTGTLTVTEIDFRVRDFDWQGDITTYDEGVATGSVTSEREYDTANVGWDGDKGAAALTTYTTSETEYPPLTHPWYSGKDATGAFSVTEWQEIFGGTTLTGNGHFILDFFDKDRSTVSGISGLTTETESSRFATVTSFGSRVFFAGLDSDTNSGVILFSRVVSTLGDIGECHQRNDPTSEEISDLLADDGGVINIPEAYNITRLHNLGGNLMVFAENGVWLITGADNIFKATEYSIQRITEVGLPNGEGFVSAAGIPFWWSDRGIHSVEIDQVSGRPSEVGLSISTIQQFWDDIDETAKSTVRTVYDASNKRIYWLYKDNGETVEAKYNRLLVLDVVAQAFYPWSIADSNSDTSYICGISYYSDNDYFDTGDPKLVLWVRRESDDKLTVAAFKGTDFLDWGNADYSSYLEAGYEFLGDLMLKKNAPYVEVFCRRTESGFEEDGDGYNYLNPSGIMVAAYWDFKSTSSSTAQQGYRLKFTPAVNPSDLTEFSYPHSVVSTRLKLRGRGHSLNIKFTSESGKNFVLLGYGLMGVINTNV